MRKLFLILLLIPYFLYGSKTIDDLEHAIKHSNVKSVQTILPELQLSNPDKKRLLDLANEIIKRRCYEWKFYVKPWAIPLKEAALLCCGTFLFSAKTILEALQNQQNQTVSNTAVAICLIVTAAGYGLIAIIKRYSALKLDKLYEDATDIKQLLHKAVVYKGAETDEIS